MSTDQTYNVPARPAPNPPVSPCAACSVRDLALCSVLDSVQLQRLARIAATTVVEAHAPIVDEGEPAHSLFNVTGGAVKLYKLLPGGRRQITGFLFAGDFLGIAMNDRYAYSAEAVDRVGLCRFPRRKLEELLDEFPSLERRLLAMASNELAQAQDQMLLLGRKTAREKLASFLMRLSRAATLRGSGGSPVAVPMSRADIGDYLGLTTETVSRTVTNLKRDGAIRLLAGGKVEIPDPVALQAIAAGE